MSSTEVTIRPNEFAKAYIQTLKVDESKFNNSEERIEYFKNEYLNALKSFQVWSILLQDTAVKSVRL